MGIEVVDLVDMAHRKKRRKNIFNTPRCLDALLQTGPKGRHALPQRRSDFRRSRR